MQYMLLIYMDEKEWAKVTPEQEAQIDEGCLGYTEELVKSGQYISAARLQPSSTATTYRRPRDTPVITDGPFAETKEVLAGYVLVNCTDLDAALAVAARFPALHVGASVEVRPVMGPKGEVS